MWKSSISKGRSYGEIGEYWDEHDLGDAWEETKPVEIEVARGCCQIREALLPHRKILNYIPSPTDSELK
jgi:hypothetical protein